MSVVIWLIAPKPTAAMPSPATITANGPKRRAAAGLRIVATIAAATPGNICSPARSGDIPTTSCRYWVTMNIVPANPKQAIRFPLTAIRRGTRNNVTSIIGDFDLS